MSFSKSFLLVGVLLFVVFSGYYFFINRPQELSKTQVNEPVINSESKKSDVSVSREQRSYVDIYYSDNDSSKIAAYAPKFSSVKENIDSLINFSIPKGFDKKVENNKIKLESSDYAEAGMENFSGIGVYIEVHNSPDPNEFIKNLPEQEQTYYVIDKQQVVINGNKAIKFYSNYEWFLRNYMIAQNNKVWIIRIRTLDKEADMKYEGIINGFMNSISFN